MKDDNSKFRYSFVVERLYLSEKNFNDKDFAKTWLNDKEFLSQLDSIKGFPIAVVLEEPEDFPNQGTFFAKMKAEDKASELIATLMGTTFGGDQTHLKNYIEDASVKGKFVECKLVSIEQVV